MKNILNQYVGRVVRLKEDVFLAIRDKALRQGHELENGFLVTEVNRSMQTLTCCYGASFRVLVEVSDAELVEASPSPFYPLSIGHLSQPTSA